MRRRAQRNCKIAILLVLCIAGFFQFVSNGGGGGKDSSGGPGPGRHGHPQRHLRKPKRVFNGTMFVPNKELASLAQLQGGRVESLYFEVDADEKLRDFFCRMGFPLGIPRLLFPQPGQR